MLRDPLGRVNLFPMTLAIVEREADDSMALLDRQREGGRRIHPAGQEDHRGLHHRVGDARGR